MDLIYMNANKEDLGVLQDYELDLAFGTDENNFECKIQASSHCCEAGYYLYMDGTEYGGIIDSVENNTETDEVTYSGRTWHGILNSKIIVPAEENDVSLDDPLPAGYTRLQYIESTGDQYMDIGIAPNQDTEFELDVAFLGSSGSNVAGVRNSTSDTTNRFGIISFSSASKLGAFFANSSIQGVAFDNERHKYNLSKSGLVVDGTLYGSSNSTTFSCTHNIVLFGWNNGSGGITKTPSRVYGARTKQSGLSTCNLIPCMSKSGVVGMYDTVTGVFNSGSGTFVAGPEYVIEASSVTLSNGVTITLKDSHGVSLIDRYLVLSGEANACVQFLLERLGLSDLLVASSFNSGLTISKYKMHRYVTGYDGIIKMLDSVGGKLNFTFRDGMVVLSVIPKHDYTEDEEFDSDQVSFRVKKNFKSVNHLVCLGSGELENRMVVHLYADQDGNISQTQTLFGMDEYSAVYDYSSVESEEELISSGKSELRSLWGQNELSIALDDTSDAYGLGDIVGAYDNITKIAISAAIIKKIVTIRDGQITISYEVGE